MLFYTPLKLRTSLSTIAGALPGALPAVIGWAAATNTLSIEGWVLFGIVFMWQMPHFLAIAWMYRDEYARAGMPLLPVIEPDGRSTGRQAVLYTAALIPLSLMPTGVGLATAWYLVGAITLGAILMVLSLEFSAKRTIARPRSGCSSDRSSTCRSSGRCWSSITAHDEAVQLAAIDDCELRTQMTVTDLPALNATLNAISFVLLLTGYVFIRRGQRQKHRACMIAALVMSALFLTSYVIYHLKSVRCRSSGTGWIRTVYFAVLIPHVILAAAIVPPVADHGVARRLSSEVRQAPRDRAVDVAAVDVCFGDRVIVYVMLYQM